jgi:surfeit locus 1 family protein
MDNNSVTFFGKNFSKGSLLLVAICSALCSFLGLWQLNRLQQKHELIANIEKMINAPAVAVKNIVDHPLYSKVKLSGRFIGGNYALLYGRRSAFPEKDGYYILSKFVADNGDAYLVSRGWVPNSYKHQSLSYLQQDRAENIEGIILPGESHGFLMPRNDAANNIWFYIDTQMAQDQFAIKNKHYYIMQINSMSLPPSALPLKAQYLSKIRNDHLEYAITWFALAGLIVLFYFFYYPKYNAHKN